MEAIERVIMIGGAVLAAIGFGIVFFRAVYEKPRPLRECDSDLMEIADAIHYPECWDTMAYPTLFSAVREIGCNNPECVRREKAVSE